MLNMLRRLVRNTKSRRHVRARLERLKLHETLCPLCVDTDEPETPETAERVDFLPPYRPDGRREAERPDPMNPVSEPFTPFPPITDEDIDRLFADDEEEEQA